MFCVAEAMATSALRLAVYATFNAFAAFRPRPVATPPLPRFLSRQARRKNAASIPPSNRPGRPHYKQPQKQTQTPPINHDYLAPEVNFTIRQYLTKPDYTKTRLRALKVDL